MGEFKTDRKVSVDKGDGEERKVRKNPEVWDWVLSRGKKKRQLHPHNFHLCSAPQTHLKLLL